MKKFIIILVVVILAGFGIYFLTRGPASTVGITPDTSQTQGNDQAGGAPVIEPDKGETVIGTSVGGRGITAYHYGTGSTEILFIGGIHGGYSWNTALVAYEAMEYFIKNPENIPENIKVTVVPVLNPDGLAKVVSVPFDSFTSADVASSQTLQVSGRFNANEVDLNRNFDCDWKANAKWQDKTVSGGTSAFSEPESQAVKNYIAAHKPQAVVVWYSAAGGVYSSSCGSGILSETRTLTDLYADASGYPAHENFDFYPTTGDMANWFAKQGIPAISVLLSNHTDTEWTKNQAGIETLLARYKN